MSRQGDFLIYCVETYKNARHLTGKQVAEPVTVCGNMSIPVLRPCIPLGLIISWRTSTSILKHGNLLWFSSNVN